MQPAEPHLTTPSRWHDLWLLGLGAAALFLVALGARDLWNPNEPIYGRVVVEMWESQSWLLPTINDAAFAEKPILYYWLALAISKAFGGVSELTLRLPSMLAGVGAVLLTYLLVLPYAGRRRAFTAGMFLATMYLVWWESRTVQMDSLVLLSTLGAMVPLSRMIDFSLSQSRAWSLAGVAAGLGFVAKGPVTWVLPAIVFVALVSMRRAGPGKWVRGLPWGVLVALALAAPWYVLLWATGHTDALYEVLVRQNFARFATAWDHVEPWHYYATYVVVDYLPWSLFVPLAIGLPDRDGSEKRLDSLAWVWLVGIVVFFSLSDSKRAPYLLPIAPAIAVLASGVFERLRTGRMPAGRRGAVSVLAGLLGAILAVAAVGLVVGRGRLHADMAAPAVNTALGAALGATVLLLGLWRARRRPEVLPATIAAAMVTVYVAASIWILPAANVVKSARPWAEKIEGIVEPDDTLVSYGFFRWRAGYPYYAGRSIRNYLSPEDLVEIWGQEELFLLVEDNAVDDVRRLLGDVPLVLEHHFAKRVAYLFTNRVDEAQ